MTLIDTNLLSGLMTFLNQVLSVEDVSKELKDLVTPLRNHLCEKVDSESLVMHELNLGDVIEETEASNVLNEDDENIQEG